MFLKDKNINNSVFIILKKGKKTGGEKAWNDAGKPAPEHPLSNKIQGRKRNAHHMDEKYIEKEGCNYNKMSKSQKTWKNPMTVTNATQQPTSHYIYEHVYKDAQYIYI